MSLKENCNDGVNKSQGVDPKQQQQSQSDKLRQQVQQQANNALNQKK